MLAWHQPGLGDACQSGKMALFFMFNILFLPNYRVKYYDYIVKLFSGVTCYWGISMDNAYTRVQSLHPCWTRAGSH